VHCKTRPAINAQSANAAGAACSEFCCGHAQRPQQADGGPARARQAGEQHGGRSRRRAQDEDGGAHVLRNGNGMELHVLRVGAAVQRLLVPDRAGRLADVVLGFDSEVAYEVRRPARPPPRVPGPLLAGLPARRAIGTPEAGGGRVTSRQGPADTQACSLSGPARTALRLRGTPGSRRRRPRRLS